MTYGPDRRTASILLPVVALVLAIVGGVIFARQQFGIWATDTGQPSGTPFAETGPASPSGKQIYDRITARGEDLSAGSGPMDIMAQSGRKAGKEIDSRIPQSGADEPSVPPEEPPPAAGQPASGSKKQIIDRLSQDGSGSPNPPVWSEDPLAEEIEQGVKGKKQFEDRISPTP